MAKKYFLVFVLVVFAEWCNAQTDQFIYYDLSDVVDNEVIKGVIKDSRGFIWFATDQGVLKYDGRSATLFNEGLQSNYTKNFLNTSDNRLLVINDYGVSEIEEGDSIRFIPFKWGDVSYDQNFSFPKNIYQDQKGNIWIGEYNSLVRISKEGLKRFELGNDYQSISYHRTFSFREDAFGTLWIAPFKGSLLRYDSQRDRIIPVEIELPITEITGLSVIRGDYLLLGGKEGLYELKIDSDQQVLSTRFYDEVKNISALQAARDYVFIGTWDNGLQMMSFEDRSFSSVDEVDFLDVVDFYYDETVPELWVVGSENVGLISFSVIHSFQSVGRSRVESVTVNGDQVYYSIGQELKTFSFNDMGPSRTLAASNNDYFDRIQADDEAIWIGSSFGTIMRYDIEAKSFSFFGDSTGASIKYVTIDHQGNKWFAGDSQLLKITKESKLKLYKVTSSNIVRQGLDGAIYVGCWGSQNLFKWNPRQDFFEEIKLELGIDLKDQLSVEDIAFDASNNLWLATNHGLFKLEDTKINRISVPGIVEDAALKAIAIKDEIVWLSGDFGLAAFDGTDALIYNTKNGIPSKLLNWRGLIPYKEGILISTAKGLVMAKSDLVRFEKTPEPVVLNITSENEVIRQESGVYRIPFKGSLEVEYTTLTYPGKQVLYQSRLIGLHDEWTEPTTNRQVSYLGFSEGEYQLEVRSREIGSLWSDPVVISFVVPKPWFYTWWAMGVFLVVALAIIVGVVRIYNYSLILQKKRFRKIIEERTTQINEQKNEIIAQKNRIIEQKEQLLTKSESIHKSQQALADADVNFLHLKEKQLKDQIEYRDKQITTQSLNLIQKNETLKTLKDKLEDLSKAGSKTTSHDLKKVLKLIDESYKHDKDWEDFKLYFEQVYTGFYAKLKINCPALTTQELRHCALVRLNLSVSECASILGISPESVKVSRSRIRKKIGLEGNKGLTDFILSI